MKKVFVLLGFAAMANTAVAQTHKHDYGVSVYDNFSRLPFSAKKAASLTQEKVKSLFPGFNTTTDKLTGMPRDIYGKTIAVPGASLTEKSQNLISNQLAVFELNAAEWKKMNEVTATHAGFVHFKQYITGREVVFSQLSFRYTPAGLLQRIVLKSYGQIQPGTQPLITRADVLNTAGIKEKLALINITNSGTSQDWVWFPIPTANGYVLHPAWPFTVSGTDKHDEAMPVELTGYADATDGTLLYVTNEVKEEINVVVKGNVYASNLFAPITSEPLANLAITIGSNTAYTNDTGFYTNIALNPPQTVAVKLQGRWSTVRNITSGGTIPSFNYTIATNGTTYTYPTTSPSGDGHVNAYYHTNRMHEYMKKFYPAFTGLDISLPTVVDVASSSGCNAFYNGTSINFYAENASCNSFAKVSDIVYHEYGHGINGKFYAFIKGSGGMSNGGLNEGYADVWALSLTKDPILGRGAFKSGGNIRTYGATPKVYPKDRTSEVHANGEIIAGAWWDYGVNLGNVDSMASLFAKTLFDVPDGPEGTEGEVFHEVLISAILNDDNDADLTNGTPHLKAITEAFARHGIFLMSDAKLDHKEIAHQKDEFTPIDVNANIAVTEPAYFKGMKLVYKNRKTSNTWDTLSLNNTGAGATGGINFGGQIPAQPSGSIIEYFFITYDLLNTPAYTFPNGYNTADQSSQVTIPYQFGIGLRKILGTDFETTATDWAIGTATTDNATSGKWIQAIPVASYWRPSGVSPYIQQPGNDNTTGAGACLVTGNASSTSSSDGLADVDGGKTTAVSPIIDITGLSNPIIEFYRWYANDQGGRDTNPRSDLWQAQVRDENSSLWRLVDNTYQSDYNWRRKLFYVKDYLSTSTKIQVRFVAMDDINTSLSGNGQNTVEAAVDDFSVYDAWTSSVNTVAKTIAIQVYPNPADNVLYVNLQSPDAGNITLYDLTGRQIANVPTNNKTNKYSISTANLPSGIYMLMIQNGAAVQTQKITVSH